jgi:hypothetical protein
MTFAIGESPVGESHIGELPATQGVDVDKDISAGDDILITHPSTFLSPNQI